MVHYDSIVFFHTPTFKQHYLKRLLADEHVDERIVLAGLVGVDGDIKNRTVYKHSSAYPYTLRDRFGQRKVEGYHLKNEDAWLPSFAWLMSSVASAQSLIVINSGTLAIAARFSE